MKRVEVYSYGIVHMSICAEKGATEEEIVRAAAVHPAGGGARWMISEAGEFADGTPMPCPCESDPDRLHWLVSC